LKDGKVIIRAAARSRRAPLNLPSLHTTYRTHAWEQSRLSSLY